MLLSEHVIHELAAELVRLILIIFEDMADPSETRLSEPSDGDCKERETVVDGDPGETLSVAIAGRLARYAERRCLRVEIYGEGSLMTSRSWSRVARRVLRGEIELGGARFARQLMTKL